MGFYISQTELNVNYRTKRKIYALVITIAVLGMLEIGARIARVNHPDWFSMRYNGTYMFPDERLLWKMPPGTYREMGVTIEINSLGMRGAELAVPKPADTYRLLFLGDSSVYGDGVEQDKNFPSLTGGILSAKWGRPVEIANAALPGYSSIQARIYFENYVDRIDPDGLVVATIWSDVMGRAMSDKQLFDDFDKLGYRFVKSTRELFRYSALFCLLETQIETVKPPKANHIIDWTSIVRGDPEVNSPRVSTESHLANLLFFGEQCRVRGIEIYYLILPYDKDMAGEKDPLVEKYRDNFRRAASAFDVPTADETTVFAEQPRELDSTWFIDGLHPSVTGHELIAESLAEVILKAHSRQ